MDGIDGVAKDKTGSIIHTNEVTGRRGDDVSAESMRRRRRRRCSSCSSVSSALLVGDEALAEKECGGGFE